MANSMENATLALGGVFLATHLVREIAHRGAVEPAPFEVCMRSIFELDPPDTESVYGGRAGLRAGLQLVAAQLGGPGSKRDFEITKYVVAVLHLERKLAHDAPMLQRLRDGVERVRAQAGYFSSHTHDSVVAGIADLYVNTISTLTPRIIVSGSQGHLNDPGNANKVRALLLAAIRSAVLWRQNGGSRLQLMFRRRQIAQVADRLIV
ncbi:MAG: high frequency lysogenization protein HflD [Gammaproteobacteria bacterium]|jgi:high frequency lysogenization protein|nr:high frequency lysogenization protein HflD [Gammaproteobacteria bacterium]